MAKIMLVIGFLIAFAAGLTVGMGTRGPSVARGPEVDGPPPPPRTTTGPATRQGRGSPGSWFAAQLGLDADQRQKMDAIWSEVARGGRQEMDKGRDELRKERDEAIVALVGPENKSKYDAIQQNYRDKQQAMERKMRDRFENAVKETEKILNDEQRTNYKALLARHRPPGGERGGPRGGPGGPDGFRGPGGPDRDRFEHRPGEGGATPSSRPQP